MPKQTRSPKAKEMETAWTIYHFSQGNPHGADQGNVPALLRRLADTLEGMGGVSVQDIVFKTEPDAEEAWVSATVYYYPARRS
jgi:hypothetical protein